MNIKRIGFSIIISVGLVFLLEAMLALLSAAIPGVARVMSRNDLPLNTAISDKKLGYRPNPQYSEHDRNGFRNKSIPKNASVVALGDSQTYGVGVSPEQAWPQQLAYFGKIATYNMAFSAWGPTHSLLLLQEAIDLKPRLIIEAFYAGNDLYDSYFHVYGMGQLPELKADDPNTLKAVGDAETHDPLPERISRLFDNSLRDSPQPTNAVNGSDAHEHGFLREYLAEHSKLYGLARAAKVVYQNKTRVPSMSRNLDWLKSNQQDSTNKYWQIFDDGRMRTIFTPDYRLCALDLDDPRIAEGFRISLKAIDLMNQRAQAAGIKFVVLLLPSKELSFKNVVLKHPDRVPAVYRTLVHNEELMWRETKHSLTLGGIYFIDTLPVLNALVNSGIQPYKASWDGHPNSLGHSIIAQLVLSEIEQNNLLEPTRQIQ